MNKNILIATKNKDKLFTIKSLLEAWNPKFFSKCHWESLTDLSVTNQIHEEGDILNRALIKARNAYNQTTLIGRKNIDYIIGSDDGMKFFNLETDTDSKTITRKILSENLLRNGDTLTVVRAFSFLDKTWNTLALFETEIPFSYKETTKEVLNLEDTYPLNQVLTMMDCSSHISTISSIEMNAYYLKYCTEALSKNLSFLNT